MTKFFSFCFYFAVTCVSSFANNYNVGDTLKVFTKSGLKLRESPDISSKMIELMGFAEKVIVENTFNFTNQQVIQGVKGNWILVRHGENKGYAFDGYLSALPLPLKDIKADNGCDLPDFLWQYGSKRFLHSSPPVNYYNWSDGESSHRMIIQTLQDSNQVVTHGYWEGYETEFFLYNIRFSEAINLVVLLSQECGLDISKEVDEYLNNSGEGHERYFSANAQLPDGMYFEITVTSTFERMTIINISFPCC